MSNTITQNAQDVNDCHRDEDRGCCPRCNSGDGYVVTVERDEFKVCEPCKVYWCCGNGSPCHEYVREDGWSWPRWRLSQLTKVEPAPPDWSALADELEQIVETIEHFHDRVRLHAGKIVADDADIDANKLLCKVGGDLEWLRRCMPRTPCPHSAETCTSPSCPEHSFPF